MFNWRTPSAAVAPTVPAAATAAGKGTLHPHPIPAAGVAADDPLHPLAAAGPGPTKMKKKKANASANMTSGWEATATKELLDGLLRKTKLATAAGLTSSLGGRAFWEEQSRDLQIRGYTKSPEACRSRYKAMKSYITRKQPGDKYQFHHAMVQTMAYIDCREFAGGDDVGSTSRPAKRLRRVLTGEEGEQKLRAVQELQVVVVKIEDQIGAILQALQGIADGIRLLRQDIQIQQQQQQGMAAAAAPAQQPIDDFIFNDLPPIYS